MPAKLNLRGRVFERLTVLYEGGHRGARADTAWICRCSCGNIVEVRTASLTKNNTRSCGCLKLEAAHLYTHGMKKHPLYKIWLAMKQRCFNPNDKGFKNYGLRGITVCKRWMDFAKFYADMGERPYIGATLERRDNDKGYGPTNCYWAPRLAQANNARSNVRITFDGRTKTMAQWARELGMSYKVLRNRLRVYGWSVERSLTTPVGSDIWHRKKSTDATH